MSQHLDLEEQEQLEELKHFWKQYGNWITWLLIVVLGSYAAWNGYHLWQRNQASQSSALFDEVEKAAQSGDLAMLERSLADMKSKFSSTTYAQQAALMAAKTYDDKGKTDEAKAALRWVAEQSSDAGYQAIARLRLAGLLAQSKAYDEAVQVLGVSTSPEFSALVADRLGDIYLLQGKKDQAREQFDKAYKGMDERNEFRRLVAVKLNALGVEPAAAPVALATAGANGSSAEVKK